ncbi:PQQ-dependent sugar dehydrogenase [Sphingomonas sp.]|uniref:PQQ-dependent sugar dehydrogenase n=1 Tax=Sphingomonas sp. TaxID=28214 RepID=UPI00286E39B6|nr:PQQ-dependent sugar dehydrogenase [Sphingomonas sp.]
MLASAAACAAAPSQPAAAAADPPFSVSEVARFDAPWAMDFLPGSGVRMTGAALVTEKGGKLWLVSTGSGTRQEVSGVPQAKVAGQGGLGDVVAHPDFAGNQRIYLSFVEAGPGGTGGAAVGYGRLLFTAPAVPGAAAGVSLDGFKVIWRQTPKVDGDGHFAHRIAFAPDGTLFLTSGDRQKMQPAQDRAGDLGKVIHLTAEGERINGRFVTLGHRNPLGIAFAPDGRLWSTEMGPQGGDELNLIVPGKNYGWPVASYGSHYGGEDIPDDHRGAGFEEPKAWWNPSVSPGGLLIYSGDLFKGWKGDALIPALSGKALIRVDIDGDSARKADHWPMGARIRAVDQGPRGEIYLLEDGPSGRLLRLGPKPIAPSP